MENVPGLGMRVGVMEVYGSGKVLMFREEVGSRYMLCCT
jgi:hypothetical protein